ncbi:MAG: tryptophan halogenase family protein [Sphingomonas sp.]
MDHPQIKRVVIAGGGTAGWVTAAALVKHLGALIDITLVESDAIGTVGVGESTIPTARTFHQFLGINEPVFVSATQASFKLGIEFENWRHIGDRYFHSFGSVGRSVLTADFQHFWLEARRQGFGGDFGDYSLELQAAATGKFATSPESPLAYAYHLDATAYARFLRGLAEPAGVTRVEGKIVDVAQNAESGMIDALVLDSGIRIEGDLFIDCTGFRALLIDGAMNAAFEDWSQWLSTDSAFAVQTESTGAPVPYTRAIAHEAGWRWRIPLQHRVGNGLVFSSADMSDDAARSLLLDLIDGTPLFDPRLIRYRSGFRSPWKGNCIALGLSGGFLEPLESTSIHLIMIGVTRLIQLFPFDGLAPALADRFNDQTRREWEHVRDFLIMHYKLTDRDDSSFWRRCRDMPIPDSLAARIALFREAAMAHQGPDELFRIDSWVQVMMGQGIEPKGYHHIARTMPPQQLSEALGNLRQEIAARLAPMPSHQEFLRRYAPAPVPTSA